MAKTIQEERLRWVLPIIKKEVKLCESVRVFPHGKRTLERWVALYRQFGSDGLIPKSTQPKTNPGETTIHIKEQVIALRKETKLCALKLKWRLAKSGVHLHERTVGKIIKVEGLVRKYHVRKIKYTYIKAVRQPGDLVEIDVKYVPGPISGHQYYQYTAIDCASRWRYLAVYDDESSLNSVLFLREVLAAFPHRILAIKTDNGSIFTNYYLGTNKRSDLTVKTLHGLDQYCADHGIVHYLIDPGKPAQNGTVERSHRSDQEAFYDRQTFASFRELFFELKRWNEDYNKLEHCGLGGLSPMEYLENYLIEKPPNVRT
jgi:transposase InsO family protein